MRNTQLAVAGAVFAAALYLCPTLGAESARAIVDRADAPFRAARIYSLSEMTVYRSGEARPTLKVESFTMNRDGKSYSLTLYRSPPRMKGTAYLMIGDDLWVRFASTGRTRKLSSSARKNSAGGTDFSYYDLAESGEGLSEKYTVRLDRDNVSVQGERCYQLTLLPKEGSDLPYEKVIAAITREGYRYLRLEYYEHGAQTKTLSFSDYREVEGRAYPFHLVMKSHIRDSRTEVITRELQFDSPRVREEDFSVTYLQRLR